MKTTLLILAKNEIEGLKVVGPRINKAWVDEVLVIDGGSTDGTIEYARSLGFRVLPQRNIPSMKQSAIAEGYKEGIAAAKGDIVITFTPDNNMIPERLPELVAKMKEGYDMVVVSRYAQGAKSEDDHAISAFGNWMFTTMVNVLWKSNYTDVLGLYRAIRKDLLVELNIDPRITIDTQLSIRCAKYGKKVLDIPGDEPPRIGGESSRSIIINGLLELYTIFEELFLKDDGVFSFLRSRTPTTQKK